MNEIICIDDQYSNENLEHWAKYGVKHPIDGKIYTIRDWIQDSNGQWGIRVNEIINPKIPTKHPILGQIMWEPTFHIRRFSDLLSKLLKREKINTHEEKR